MFCCTKTSVKKERLREEGGQATIEAAFLLPVVLMVLLLVAQPAIILYTQCSMNAAAAEGCRTLSTRVSQDAEEKYVGFVKRRLGAVPPIDIFHVHAPCSWDVELRGGQNDDFVSVTITNKFKPLPLVGTLWVLGLPKDGEGYVTQTVSVSSHARPSWVVGLAPLSLHQRVSQ